MDPYKIKNTAQTISAILGSLADDRGPLTADTALKILFDRRLSSLESYKQGWDYLDYPSYEDFPELRNRKFVTFVSGGNKLTGHLFEQPSPKGIFLCVHGLTGLSEDVSSVFHAYFFRHGYDVLAIDLTASGRSEGMKVKGLSQSGLDVRAAVEFLSTSPLSKLPLFLFGHSWGAYGIAASLNFTDRPLAIFPMSGFTEPFEVMTELIKSKVSLGVEMTEPALKAAMAKRDSEYAFLSGKQGIEKAQGVYCLLIHGDHDDMVVPRASLFHADYSRNGVEKYLMEGRGHGDVAASMESIAYIKQVKAANLPLYEAYKRNPSRMSPGERAEFASSFNKMLTYVPDEALFQRILDIADKLGQASSYATF